MPGERYTPPNKLRSLLRRLLRRADGPGQPEAARGATGSTAAAVFVDRGPHRLAHEVGRAFAQRLRLEELIPFAVARCREVLDAEGVAVLLYDRERDEL